MDRYSNRETMLNKDYTQQQRHNAIGGVHTQKATFPTFVGNARHETETLLFFFSFRCCCLFTLSQLDYVNRIKIVENDHIKIEISFQHRNNNT